MNLWILGGLAVVLWVALLYGIVAHGEKRRDPPKPPQPWA